MRSGGILDGGARDERDTEPIVIGRARPLMSQSVRTIDWRRDSTDAVIRRIRAGEGHPGVLDAIHGCEFHVFGAHRERILHGRPGKVDRATRRGRLPRHARRSGVDHSSQAARHAEPPVFQAARHARAGSWRVSSSTSTGSTFCSRLRLPADETYREIAYEEHAGVGYLRFDFYNGAMSTEQCLRLRDAYTHARARRETG